jgi:molybdopterin molybdotransferase
MMRAASAALMPLVEARALLLALADPVPSEVVPLAVALGHVCAEPVLAPRDVPERTRASRDGYAVAAAELGGASPYAPVRLLATPFWVEAGADLPDGTDAVLPPEGLEGRDAVADVFVHEGVRERADDLSSGDVVVARGERIASRHILALAHCALSEIRVRRPRVTLIVTGAPAPEALSAFLTVAIAREGGTARIVAVPDSEQAIATAILDTDAHAILPANALDKALPSSMPPAAPAAMGRAVARKPPPRDGCCCA